MWRYEEVLPDSAPVTLGEGMTPLIHARRLGAHFGLEKLYIKEEGQNPTGSFKARGLSAAVSMAKALGVETIALPTAGNAGGAAAAYAAQAGLRCVVAMPSDTPIAIVLETRACGADVRLIDGLISHCGAFIAEEAARRGWYEVSTLKEPYRIEGKKTMGYELWEEFEGTLPDVIVYPTGGGVGLIGMWKAFEELEEMRLTGSHRPRMIAAQAEGCAPIVKAFEQRAESSERWENAATLAAGLRVPKALGDFLILADIYASRGEAVAVSEDALLDGCRDMARLEGIFAAPEGGAGLAAIQTLIRQGKIATSISRPGRPLYVERLAASSRRMSSAFSFSVAIGISSSSCATVLALAIGAATVGLASSHARETAATGASCAAAISSSADSTRCPCSFTYSCAPFARAL
jgi:threonine synthase